MQVPIPLRNLPQDNIFRKGDVFVLFGELFGRGYANGLVNEARNAGMTIIGVTVGRRDENNALRALTAEELATAEANLGGRIINVPLMAGFDLDAPHPHPRISGKSSMKNVPSSVSTLSHRYEPTRHTPTHTMAGGLPKKVFTIANRVYKQDTYLRALPIRFRWLCWQISTKFSTLFCTHRSSAAIR
jgi:hypothetical protein